MMKKTLEEIRSRNSETMLHMKSEQVDFVRTFIWAVFTFRRTPLNDGSTLKNPIIHQRTDPAFRKLAFLPSSRQSLNFLSALGFPRRHPECHKMLHSHVLGGYRRGKQKEIGFLWQWRRQEEAD